VRNQKPMSHEVALLEGEGLEQAEAISVSSESKGPKAEPGA